ncbi:hypothetical protein GS982_20585 [Rhodococcus hoagii]|nr:hypothetical protein [Prescottella equi]
MPQLTHTEDADAPAVDVPEVGEDGRWVGTDSWAATATASKIPGMLGLNKPGWDQRKATWLKMQHARKFPRKSNSSQKRGNFLEAAFFAMWFEQNPDWEPISDGEITFTRDDLGFPAAATPDYRAKNRVTGEELNLEGKTLGGNGDREAWGEPGTDQVPLYYLIQVYWQMIVSGDRRAFVVRYGPFIDDLHTYVIVYDEAIAAKILAGVTAFMQSLADDVEPENDGLESSYKAMQRVYTDTALLKADEDWEVSLDFAIDFTTRLLSFDLAEAELFRGRADALKIAGKAKRLVVKLPPEIGKSGKPLKAKNLIIASRQIKGGTASIVRPKTPVTLEKLRELQALRDAAEAQEQEAAA